MSLSGTVQTYPLPDLLQWLSMTRKTGILSVVSGQILVKLVFRDGILITASSNDASRRLGQCLLGQGLITEAQLAEVLDLQAGELDGQRLGKILSERGFVVQDDVGEALTEGTQEIVYELFLLDDAMFSFTPDLLPAEGSMLVELNLRVDSLIMEGARRLDEWRRFREVLPSERSRVSRVAGAEAAPDAPELWSVLLWLLERPHSVAELIVAARRPSFTVHEALFGMHAKRLIEVSQAGGAVREVDAGATSIAELEQEVQRLVEGCAFARARDRIERYRDTAREGEQLTELAVMVAESELRHLRQELPGNAMPRLAVGLEQVQRLELNPKDAFLISRLDESMDIRTLCMILPMTDLEVLRALLTLREQGVITV